ncbi:MAG TPA: DUF6263 family protein [Gemmataceae bacterium]|jgi:hypothetical protein|nr:DUF6263 family protein [Gemmataceae bacterium]
MWKLPWTPVLVVLWASPAQGQVNLEWRLKKGETFYAERIDTQKQSVEIKSKSFMERRAKTWLNAITVKETTAAGYVLDVKVESVKFDMAGERSRLSPPRPAGFEDRMAARIQGSRFTIALTRQGKLTRLQGYDALIAKLAGKDGELENALKVLLPEEALHDDIEGIFHFLPMTAVRKRDHWKRETTEPVPPFGSFQSAIEYTLEEDRGNEIPIGYTIKMAYKPPSGDGDFFRVIKGGLKGEEGKGKIVFDVQRGRLVTSEQMVRVRGELLVESMGKQVKLEFASDNTVRVRVFSKDEAKKDCMSPASGLNISHCQVKINQDLCVGSMLSGPSQRR